MSETLVQWFSNRLTNLLHFPGNEDVARYVLSIESVQDVQDYLLEIVDKENPEHVRFVEEFIKKLENKRNFKNDAKRDQSCSEKPRGAKPKHKNMTRNNEDYKQKITKSRNPTKATNDSEVSFKKKQKYVSIYSKEGKEKDIIQLPGRHECDCLATKHKLINNCIKCGRIVCQQEGSGPCFFCGNLVCTSDEQKIMDRGSKKSQKLYETLMDSKLYGNQETADEVADGDLEKAVKHKNKLLEFDRTCERRTHVIDDSADYYSTNSNKWLTSKERKLLKETYDETQLKKRNWRKDRKITLDFAGSRVVMDDEDDVKSKNVIDPVLLAANYGVDVSGTKLSVNPNLEHFAPQYEDNNVTGKPSSTIHRLLDADKQMRLQDSSLQMMSDEGKCLSMHQPYASLLTSGVKMHEGRNWYTAHRGRLWIASTVKSPNEEETQEVLQMYKTRKGHRTDFPQNYSTGCLLGCVDVVDCLGQEEYRQLYPDGESLSPYVFICENPQELVLKFPLKGQHKIYKLDPSVHQAAQNSIRTVKSG